ncbi:MAG: replication initiator protein A [Candidatus Aerophobetes bacterium]|nr:replication initiator protein A [Candidatus Aerophobetes bacterium]
MMFPFFALSKKGLRQKLQAEYKDIIRKDNQQLEISWQVTANVKYGYPGPFDREAHKVIEQIIDRILDKEGQVVNPLCLGSLYGLCKKMGIADSGENKKRIKKSLQRIVATTVTSEGAFFSKKVKRRISDTFHLYDRAVFKDEELPDGNIADTNYLFLGSWYLQSINNFYVKPLNYKYLQSLKSKTASRLYEILGVRFYGLKNRKQSYVWFYYQKLCQLLPITIQKHFSHAKKYLEPAHNELVKTGFLNKVRWREDKDSWLIRYYPGRRAKKEIRKRREINSPDTGLSSNRSFLSSLDSKAQNLVCYFQNKHNQIKDYKVKKKELEQAQRLIDQYGEEKAKYIVNYALKKASRTNYKMKYFGAILNYIEEASKVFKEEKVREKREREKLKQQIEEKKLQEKKDKEWLANPEFTKEMEGFLGFRIKNFELQNKRRPTKEKMEKLKREIIENKIKRLTEKYKN